MNRRMRMERKNQNNPRDDDRRCDTEELHRRRLVVIYIPEEPDAIPPERRDYSRPFWVGTPVE